jgi:D-amino peptidase
MQSKRLYISSDIEGVAGVTTIEQLLPTGFEYQQAREWMTNEVIAACEAAFECGIEEIVISDSHGNGQNLLLDRLPANVQLVRSWPRPLCMMEGIQEGNYAGALLLGYHPGATDLRGVLAHTLSGRGIAEVKLNGMVASETVISAATAGHYQVPVIMVSGDDAYAEHARSVLDNVETAAVKWANSTTSTRTLRPVDACELIATKVTNALQRVSEFNPFTVELPVTVDVRCVSRKSAELLCYLPMFERSAATSVQFIGKNMVEVSQVFSFLLASGSLSV